MSFASDLKSFVVRTESRLPEVVAATGVLALESIKVGSPITGAPGQPVDTGALRNSWQLEMESPLRALVSTNIEYAPAIEEGIGPHGAMTLRSAVGGFHSRSKTIAGGQRLVDEAVRRVTGGTPGGAE